MDFSALILAAIAACVAILVIDRAVRASKRRRGITARREESAVAGSLVYQARSILPVLVIVLLVRAFVFEPFRIPSASMMPGLVDGDFIFVNKYSYGLRLPVVNTKILTLGGPRRGDVVVFRLPRDPSINYIKRLVGLPGDHVQVRDNRVYVNGVEAALTPAGTYSGGYGFDGSALGTERFGSTEHTVMFAPGRFATDFDRIVPAGEYFFMGDNRNDSQDSRFSEVGFVPDKNLVGHASRIWLNFRWLDWPRWRRIGTKIS